MTNGLERRTIAVAAARPEVRDVADGKPVFVGHAAVFGQRTLIGRMPWGFYEEFDAGAFADTIADGGASLGLDQAMLVDHATYYVVSRAAAGTLRLSEDQTGLAVESDLDTRLSYVSDLVTNLGNGNITGMSIGMYVDEDTWSMEEISSDAGPISVEVRRITKASLAEVSAVTFPAFPQTDAALRDLVAELRDNRTAPPTPAVKPAPVLDTRYADALAARYGLTK